MEHFESFRKNKKIYKTESADMCNFAKLCKK